MSAASRRASVSPPPNEAVSCGGCRGEPPPPVLGAALNPSTHPGDLGGGHDTFAMSDPTLGTPTSACPQHLGEVGTMVAPLSPPSCPQSLWGRVGPSGARSCSGDARGGVGGGMAEPPVLLRQAWGRGALAWGGPSGPCPPPPPPPGNFSHNLGPELVTLEGSSQLCAQPAGAGSGPGCQGPGSLMSSCPRRVPPPPRHFTEPWGDICRCVSPAGCWGPDPGGC